MNSRVFFVSMIILGIATGLSASYISQTSAGKCEKVQEDIRAGQNFTGTVTCYPPGVLDVNISDQVENSTELKCVCRKINGEEVQIFPILYSN